MGLKIADLLRWRTSITIKQENGEPFLNDDNEPITLWLRIVGDEDLQDSYKVGRVASAKKRKEMRDITSDDYITAIEPMLDAPKEALIEVVRTARTQNLYAEAVSVIERPDELQIEEFAIDPDAPTLEEQEQYDAAVAKQTLDYAKAIGDYQIDRVTTIEKELDLLTREEVLTIAQDEISDIAALTAFFTAMTEYKMSKAVYHDKICREPAFADVREYRQTAPIIRDQLVEAYQKLEAQPDEIKN